MLDKVHERLQFLEPLGIDIAKLDRLIGEDKRLLRGGIFPLIDPERAEGLQELIMLLYHLGFSPREVGEALQGLPQLADMSTATMGLRVLRCKAIGMDRGNIIRLIRHAPVCLAWEDECMPPRQTSTACCASHAQLCSMSCHATTGALIQLS